MAEIERQTAVKCKISDLNNGSYIVQEGWKPNFVDTVYGKISRANILAVVVSKESMNQVFVDDGSGKISVREFDSTKLADLEVGDVVVIIGRPRQFNNQMYILPEIVKKIDGKKWVELRKLELDQRKKIKQEEKKDAITETKQAVQKPLFNYSEKILETIKNLDKGQGADIDDVITAVKFKEAEEVIMHLLEEGELFEIRPGKLKVLE
jgi:RPA family protein